jgi:hypothetical protein
MVLESTNMMGFTRKTLVNFTGSWFHRCVKDAKVDDGGPPVRRRMGEKKKNPPNKLTF